MGAPYAAKEIAKKVTKAELAQDRADLERGAREAVHATVKETAPTDLKGKFRAEGAEAVDEDGGREELELEGAEEEKGKGELSKWIIEHIDPSEVDAILKRDHYEDFKTFFTGTGGLGEVKISDVTASALATTWPAIFKETGRPGSALYKAGRRL